MKQKLEQDMLNFPS